MKYRLFLICLVSIGAITDTIFNFLFWIIGVLYVLTLFLLTKDAVLILSCFIVYFLTFFALRLYGYYLVYSALGVIERDAIKKKHPFLTYKIEYR